MREITLIIDIKPQAKQSVRKGRNNHFYQDKKYTDWKEIVQWQVKAQLPKDWTPYSKQVVVRKLQYCFKSKKKGPKVTRPDLMDNLNKLPMDSLNGIVYTDDSLIWKSYETEKIYCDKDQILLILEGE